jgi:hypothetical protein
MPQVLSPRRSLLPAACALLHLAEPAAATVWNVPGHAATIQAGLDLAAAGDTVLVGPGTWAGAGNVNLTFAGRDIVLRSSAGRDLTVIHCGNVTRGLAFTGGETRAAVVEGFTIRDGNAPTGGGLLVDESSPTLRGCRFVSCFASSHGGAADLQDSSSPRFEDCVFDSNGTSGSFKTGGAIQLLDDGEFARCTFRNNAAGGIGGAIRMFGAGDVTFDECSFEGNLGTDGGALAIQTAQTVTFDLCTFVANRGTSSSGALLITGGLNTLTGCLFDLNESDGPAGAVSVSLAGLHLNNCTVARTVSDSTSAALTVTNLSSGIFLNNTIIFGSVSGAAIRCSNFGNATPVCTNLFGNAGGDWDTFCGAGEDTLNGNFSLDPLFCDAAAGDFHLDGSSPCLARPGCGLVGALGAGCGTVTSVPAVAAEPARLLVEPAAPSPFRAATTIPFVIPARGGIHAVRLAVHDVRGRRVTTLIDATRAAGAHAVSWAGTDGAGSPVPSGVYFYRIEWNGRSETGRVVLLR